MKFVAALTMTILGLWALAPETAGAQGKPMTGAELAALLDKGKSLRLGGKGAGYSGTLDVKPDGTASGQAKADNGSWIFDIKGRWALEGDKFCRTWDGGRDSGKKVCESWVPDGKNKVKVFDGDKALGVNSW